MADTDTVGMQDVRGENIDSMVKGVALDTYKLKQVCMIQSSSDWKETYYKETNTALTGHAVGSAVKQVPRLAQFPTGEPSWTKTSAYHEKHAMQGVVSWEDAKTNAFDTIARTIIRIGQAVAYSVDNAIYDVLTADTDVNTAAATATWDAATVADRDPIFDILTAIEYMFVDFHDVLDGNGYLLVSPEDYTHLLNNDKVIHNETFKAADVVANGVVGQVCGLKIIVSNSVDDDEAAVVKYPDAMTWKQAAPLTTATIYDEGVSYTIRAWEVGKCVVTTPTAIHVITNTQA